MAKITSLTRLQITRFIIEHLAVATFACDLPPIKVGLKKQLAELTTIEKPFSFLSNSL